MQGYEELPAGAVIDPIPEGFEALPDGAQLDSVPPSAGDQRGEIQFNDDPTKVASRLAPEDEAHVTQLLRAGDVDGAAAFAHARGFSIPNADELRAGIAQGRKVGDGGEYILPKAQDQGAGAALQNAASQGASLGLSDELHGLVNGVQALASGGDFGYAYDRTVDQDRAQLGADEENHFGAVLAGNLAGGLVLPLGLERAGITMSTRAVGIAARDAALAEGATTSAANRIAARAVASRLTAEGAAYGGAYGAGSAEGGPGERLLGGGLGAASGAFAGGVVLPGLAKAATLARRGINATWGAGRNAIGALTSGGAQDRAGAIMRDSALRPIEDILADIGGREAQASGALPTLGEVANDAGLAGFQRGYANGDVRAGAAVGERNASNALARTRYASDAFGDGSPQAVQDFAGTQLAAGEAASLSQQAERQAAAEERLLAAREGASTARSEAETGLAGAREAVGLVADRAATGTAARDQFEAAYAAARQRTTEAYNDPQLAENYPVALRPAELADHYLPSLGTNDITAFREEATRAVRGALPPKPQSLLQFVRARGGVLAESVGADDLRHSGLTARAEPTLINSRGKPLDNHLEAAVEAGFVSPGTSLADFAEELGSEHRGLSRLVRPEDLNVAEDHAAAAENKRFWSRAFADQGLESHTMTDAQWSAFHDSMAPGKAQGRTLLDMEAEGSPGSVMGPFQKNLSGIRDRYFGDGATSIPADTQSFYNDVMNADVVGIKTLEGWEKRAYDMAARAPDRTTGAFLRGLGRAIGAKASAEGGTARSAALRAARAARAEQGRVFETGDAARAFGRDRYNNPIVGDTTVPSRIVRPGAAGGDTADGLIAAVGQDAAETLVRQELRRAVEEAGVQTEAQARSLSIRFGEVAKRFPGVQSDLAAVQSHAARLDAVRVAETVAERATISHAEKVAIRERSALHAAVLASPLGKVADAAVDPSSYIGGLLRRPDDGRQLRYLARQVAGNDDALAGLRRALGDFIEADGAGSSVTQAGEAIPAIARTRKAISRVLRRSGEALTPHQKAALSNVSRELNRANFAASAGKPTGSDTAINRSIEKLVTAVPTGGHGAPVKSVLKKVLAALGNEEEVKRLLTEAILDPDFAALLLKRPTAKHLVDASERFAGRKGAIFVGQATTHVIGERRSSAR